MSTTFKVLLGVIVVTIIGAIPLVSNVAKQINFVPRSTPLEVPSALKNVQESEKTFASTSATPKKTTAPYTY